MSSPAARRRPTALTVLFSVLGAILVALVLVPVMALILGTSPGSVAEALGEGTVRWSLWLTLYAALIATAIAFVFGVPLAYVLARKEFRGKSFIEGLIDVPIVFPHTAAGVALLMVYGQDGLLGRLLAPLGITFTDSVPGIVVAMMFVSLPFLLDTAREAFALVDPRYEQVARTLGASPGVAFLRTTLPVARRGVVAGVVMMWARGISEFGAVVILAYHPKIVPVLVYERFEGFGLDAAKPVAVIIVLVALVVFIVLRTVLAPRRRRSLAGAAGRPSSGPADWAEAAMAAGPAAVDGAHLPASPDERPGIGEALARGSAWAETAERPSSTRAASGMAVELAGVQARAGTFETGPLDLRLENGEYFALLGPSGCGKTVLLEAVAGLRSLAGGSVCLDGGDAAPVPPERRGVGLVFQDSLLFPNLDVAGNIAFGLGPHTVPEWITGARRTRRRAADPRVRATAELVGAGHLLTRAPDGLSGGEQQRVALARALLTEPRLLLLDEPLANLDQETREGLQAMLRRIHERFPTTVLHVTHDFPEATVLADRCAVLGDGRLHQVGTPAEVFRHPADAFVARFTGGRNLYRGTVVPAPAGATAFASPPGSPDAPAVPPAETATSAIPPEQAAAPVAVDLDGGVRLLSHSRLSGPVGVMVRPEDIEVLPAHAGPPAVRPSTAAGPSASARLPVAQAEGARERHTQQRNELRGVVDEVLDQGGTALVRAAVPPAFTALLTRRQLDALDLRCGDHVCLRFAAAAVHCFAIDREAGPAA